MSHDREIEFEEHNWDWLVDKFLREKEVVNLWSEFVYNEYQKSLQDPPERED